MPTTDVSVLTLIFYDDGTIIFHAPNVINQLFSFPQPQRAFDDIYWMIKLNTANIYRNLLKISLL